MPTPGKREWCGIQSKVGRARPPQLRRVVPSIEGLYIDPHYYGVFTLGHQKTNENDELLLNML